MPDDIYFEMEALEAIQALAGWFEKLGHTVYLIDALDNAWVTLANQREALDLVYNYSVGFGSRSREVLAASMCESLAIPYSGSDPLTLALASDKYVSKLLARAEGIRTPRFQLARSQDAPIHVPTEWSHCFIKPVSEGSSIGIKGPFPTSEYERISTEVRRTVGTYSQGALVEEFIPGFEITVPVLGTAHPHALHPVALVLDGDIDLGMRTFDGLRKASGDQVQWTADVPTTRATLRELRRAAERIHVALGCRDLSRSDFRVTSQGRAFYLETNATPQLTPEGGTFQRAAQAEGKSFEDVLGTILESALQRRQATPRTRVR